MDGAVPPWAETLLLGPRPADAPVGWPSSIDWGRATCLVDGLAESPGYKLMAEWGALTSGDVARLMEGLRGAGAGDPSAARAPPARRRAKGTEAGRQQVPVPALPSDSEGSWRAVWGRRSRRGEPKAPPNAAGPADAVSPTLRGGGPRRKQGAAVAATVPPAVGGAPPPRPAASPAPPAAGLARACGERSDAVVVAAGEGTLPTDNSPSPPVVRSMSGGGVDLPCSPVIVPIIAAALGLEADLSLPQRLLGAEWPAFWPRARARVGEMPPTWIRAARDGLAGDAPYVPPYLQEQAFWVATPAGPQPGPVIYPLVVRFAAHEAERHRAAADEQPASPASPAAPNPGRRFRGRAPTAGRSPSGRRPSASPGQRRAASRTPEGGEGEAAEDGEGEAAAAEADPGARRPPYVVVQPLTAERIRRVRAGEVGGSPILDIPGRVRHQAAYLLGDLLEDALHASPQDGAPPPLLYVWRMVWAGSPSRAVLRHRLALAQRGHLEELFDDVAPGPWGRPGISSATSRARRYMARGEVRKALSALAPPVQPVVPTEAEVRTKYPIGQAPEPACGSRTRIEVKEADVEEAVMAGGHSCAPGPDGIRHSHLRSLMPVSPRLRSALTAYVAAVANGRAIPGLSDVLLSPVPKASGGWRPIGVAGSLRRIVARILAKPVQVAVAPECELMGQLGPSKAGPQRFYLRAQRAVEAGLWVARLDIANAFGSLKRGFLVEVLNSVASKTEAVAGHLRAIAGLYSGTEEVFGRKGVHIVNNRGVTQGCPAGALAFDLSMACILAEWAHAEEEKDADGLDVQVLDRVGAAPEIGPNTVFHAALHDDLVLAAQTPELILRAIGALTPRLAEHGLALSEGKSTILVDPREVGLQSPLGASALIKAVAVPCAGLPLHLPTDAGITAAKQMLVATWNDGFAKLEPAGRMRHPQDIVRALAVAGPWSRVEYHISVLRAAQAYQQGPPRFDAEILRMVDEADALTRRLLHIALGPDAKLAGPASVIVAHLPYAKGGLGIPSAAIELRSVKYLARQLGLQDNAIVDADAVKDCSDKRLAKRDEDYSALHKFLVKNSSELRRVRLAHQAVSGVGEMWRGNVSEFGQTLLQPRSASKALAMWLLCPPVETVTVCGELRKGVPLAFGPSGAKEAHLYKCKKNLTTRHNAVYRAVGKVISMNAGTGYEILYESVPDACGRPLPRTGDKGERAPGDLVILDRAKGTFLYVDCGVNTSAAAIRADDRVVTKGSSKTLLAGVTAMNRSKISKAPDVLGPAFAPLCISGFGALDSISKLTSTRMAAFTADGTSPRPYKTPTLAAQIRSAATAALHSATARFAIVAEESAPEFYHDNVLTDRSKPDCKPFSAPRALAEFRAAVKRSSTYLFERPLAAVVAFLKAIGEEPPPPRGTEPPELVSRRASLREGSDGSLVSEMILDSSGDDSDSGSCSSRLSSSSASTASASASARSGAAGSRRARRTVSGVRPSTTRRRGARGSSRSRPRRPSRGSTRATGRSAACGSRASRSTRRSRSPRGRASVVGRRHGDPPHDIGPPDGGAPSTGLAFLAHAATPPRVRLPLHDPTARGAALMDPPSPGAWAGAHDQGFVPFHAPPPPFHGLPVPSTPFGFGCGAVPYGSSSSSPWGPLVAAGSYGSSSSPPPPPPIAFLPPLGPPPWAAWGPSPYPPPSPLASPMTQWQPPPLDAVGLGNLSGHPLPPSPHQLQAGLRFPSPMVPSEAPDGVGGDVDGRAVGDVADAAGRAASKDGGCC